MISPRADFSTKLMVANGIVMSKMCYLVQLWGGCEDYLLHALQVQLNKAARLVTGLSRFTSTRRLMDKCGWLTVKQLVRYHSISMVHKTVMTSRPIYMHSRLQTEHEHVYRTRSSTTGGIRLDQTYRHKTDLPMKSFRYRGAQSYNARGKRNQQTFNIKLKKWIRSSMHPD